MTSTIVMLGLLVLTSCVGFSEVEEVDQSQLQADAVLPDPAISPQNCPLYSQGLAYAKPMPAINEQGACGHPAPFAVQGIGGRYPVRLSTDATLNCVMMTQLHRFFTEQVQPLALDMFRQPVTSVSVAASYVCRTRNNKAGGKLSEHAKANAFDIRSLQLADGTVLTIEKDWRRYDKGGRFLRQFNKDACRYFTTVIGPDGDKYHQDHIHLDHARHGRKGTWRLCQ